MGEFLQVPTRYDFNFFKWFNNELKITYLKKKTLKIYKFIPSLIKYNNFCKFSGNKTILSNLMAGRIKYIQIKKTYLMPLVNALFLCMLNEP